LCGGPHDIGQIVSQSGVFFADPEMQLHWLHIVGMPDIRLARPAQVYEVLGGAR
jgi:hypothetical protein